MKLSNEGAMYIIIYISFSFREIFSLYDDYFDSDLIPFISISTKKAHRSSKNEDSSKTIEMTTQATYSNGIYPLRKYVSITAIPTRRRDSNEKNIKGSIKSDVYNEPLTLYTMNKGYITGYSKRKRGQEGTNILQIKNSDFLSKQVNQQCSKNVAYDSKRLEKFDVLEKTESPGVISTDDGVYNGITKRNHEDFDEYTFSKFYTSLLSLLSYLNPNLLNVLKANIKSFETYNVMKRDSMSNGSPYSLNESSSTLKTMLCNCDYCRTGKPDTVLYIVSGKKLNNNVSYHKLTSNNRSKPKTSSRYQQHTAVDNDSNRPFQPGYLPANYDKLIFGNNFDAAINEKVINGYDMTNDSRNQLPKMKLLPVSRNLGVKLMSAYKGFRNRGFYKPSTDEINESLNTPYRKIIEPKSHKHKPIFYFRNHPFSNNADSKYNNGNKDGRKCYNNDSIEIFNSLPSSTTKQPSPFSDYGNNGWNMGDSNENESKSDDGTTIRILVTSMRNAEVNEISMSTEEEISETNNNNSLVNNDTNENIGTLVQRSGRIDPSQNDVEFLTTEGNYDETLSHPVLLKGNQNIHDKREKNIHDIKHFQKVSVALDGQTSMFLTQPPTRTAFVIPPNTNEDYKYRKIINEINTVSNEQHYSTESSEKSIIDILNELMDKVTGRNVTVANLVEANTNSTILNNDRNSRSNNNSGIKNGSLSKRSHEPPHSTTYREKSGLFHSSFHRTGSTVKPSVITTIVTKTTVLHKSVNKKETYVNYDLNLRNLIGVSNIDEKIMCS